MRLFLYYSFHSTWNQLRKLFKTWLFLVMLASVFGGGLIGLSLSHSGYMAPVSSQAGSIMNDLAEYLNVDIISKAALFELIGGLIVISLFSMQIITAEISASRLFLPADINFLFTSDRTPQQNLTFRILSTVGTMVVATAYMLTQLPSMTTSLGITQYASFVAVIFWILTVIFGILMKVLVYEFTCRHQTLRNNLRYILFAIYIAIAVSFYIVYKNSENQVFLITLNSYFNDPITRFIPVYGWLKGMLAFAVDGDILRSQICIWLCVAVAIALYYAIKVIPADFYEDATIRSEELSLYMAAVNESGANLLVMRPKNRSEKIERDGFHYGGGPSVYFFKPVYNRIRFSKFGIFSKVIVTYLIAGSIASVFAREFMDKSTIYPAVAIIAGLVFFHTVISPAGEDIRKDSFTLVPESTFAKLAWSVLASTAICMMDTAIPLMVASYIAVGNITEGIQFIPLIVSVDFFASMVGIFTYLAIPASIDKTFKQVLQILLLYFALIPDVLFVADGLIRGRSASGFITAGVVDVIFGLLFFGLSGVWLESVSGYTVPEKLNMEETKKGISAFSLIGGALAISYLIVFLLQLLVPPLIIRIFPNAHILYTLSYYIPLYVIAIPACYLIISKSVKATPVEKHSLSFSQILSILPVCFFVMYLGSILGLGLQTWLQTTFPIRFKSSANPALLNTTVQSICAVICAPVLEELLFRKCIIDHTHKYGEFTAVLFSALAFGLFHGNFQQFFYAFFLGIVFGTIYIKTGKIHISMIIHIVINFMGSVIAPLLVEYILNSGQDVHVFDPMGSMSIITNPAVRTLIAYLAVLFILSMIGVVLFAHYVKSIRLRKTNVRLNSVMFSPGVAIFLVVMLGMFAYQTFIS